MINNIISIEKRGMKTLCKANSLESTNFIFGIIKYKIFEKQSKIIITPKSKSLSEKADRYEIIKKYHENKLKKLVPGCDEEKVINKMIQEDSNKIKAIENVGKEIKEFNPTKYKHGFAGVVVKDNIYITFFTSGEKSPIFGAVLDNNILINETLNPIIAVNPPQKMSIEAFKNIFNFSNPEGILKNPKFIKNSDEDLAYCCFRAFVKSLKFSPNMYQIKEESPTTLKITKEEMFQFYDDGIIKLPVQYELEECVNDANFIEEMFNKADLECENSIFKKHLLDDAWIGYKEILAIKYDI